MCLNPSEKEISSLVFVVFICYVSFYLFIRFVKEVKNFHPEKKFSFFGVHSSISTKERWHHSTPSNPNSSNDIGRLFGFDGLQLRCELRFASNGFELLRREA